MSTDWRALSREAGLTLAGDGFLVALGDGRQQQVFVEAADEQALRLWSVAGAPSRVAAAAIGESVHLVGFKIDGRGRLIGEAWVHMAGLDAAEWRVYVTAVAQACDRTEYLLSGRDEA